MAKPRKIRVTGGARVSEAKRQFARQLRRRQTPTEAQVWEWLRNRRMLNLRFRRQQVICGYVVDFYCPALHLAIELDGGVHDSPEAAEYDAFRQRVLTGYGIRMLRFRNENVTYAALHNALRKELPLSMCMERG